MSFQMYTNTSDNRVINKSLTQIGSALTCTFKDNTSMENPTIIISPDAYSSACNYGYLSDTGRYYYVADVEFSQQRVLLHLKVDVLKSFASEIKNCDCVAYRSSNKYNSYLADELYPRLQYNRPVTKAFPFSFSKKLNCILTIAGGA